MVTPLSSRSRARSTLDRRLAAWRPLAVVGARPHGGWIRAIRDALGMSAADLAERLGVAQSTVARLEASERAETIQLSTLRRAAAALECDLVYALVPRRPLEESVSERARELALQQLGRVEHTMALEDQALAATGAEDRLELLAEHYKASPGLWRADPARATTAASPRTGGRRGKGP
jgi:predicted DNA-binding mobile mystery protein A